MEGNAGNLPGKNLANNRSKKSAKKLMRQNRAHCCEAATELQYKGLPYYTTLENI
jgi:hypothetical protein